MAMQDRTALLVELDIHRQLVPIFATKADAGGDLGTAYRTILRAAFVDLNRIVDELLELEGMTPRPPIDY